jgi:hypothetical protein
MTRAVNTIGTVGDRLVWHGSDGYTDLRFPSSGGLMHATSQGTQWTPYEVKAASITHERRSEDLQLEQLRVRLQKKMREAEERESAPTAA